jgi:hypothetical protein
MGLSPATIRRLKRLPQVPHVWEGAKISLPGQMVGDGAAIGQKMVLWMDGSEGIARSLESADESFGNEVMVRSLIRAIESPQGPYPQVRPMKVLVADREEQFYLRGVLSDLDIEVGYVSELPTIQQLFERFSQIREQAPDELPPAYEQLLSTAAKEIWQTAPWEVLHDFQILEVVLDRWDVEKFYACVMGKMGQEFGILLYRTMDTVRQFRAAAVAQEDFDEMNMESLEKTFLSQDCIFCSYDLLADQLPGRKSNYDFNYGSIHPLEGIRSLLDPEEALATYAALMAIKKFFVAEKANLLPEAPLIQRKIKITLPKDLPIALDMGQTASAKRSVEVQVSTMPYFSQELMALTDGEWDDEEDDDDDNLQDDLLPDRCAISTGTIPWSLLEELELTVPRCTVQMDLPLKAGMPVIIVQSTRQEMLKTINHIVNSGGLESITFSDVVHPVTGEDMFLGVAMLSDGEFQVIGEFSVVQGKNWIDNCKKSQGRCAFIIAQGFTARSKLGPPKNKDILAIWEAKVPKKLY